MLFGFCTLAKVNSYINLIRRILAWSVHVFTSLGLLAAFMAIIALDEGDWRACFLWLLVSFFIDGIDGTLARLFQVENVLPSMDGKNIDYVIDFTTYALIPAIFFYKADMVEAHLMIPSIVFILISSALYYGKKGMVEDDQYFIGFPVLWNFVVFFQFFIFQNNQTLNFYSVIVIAIMHFVPLKYAYPSRARRYFFLHLAVSIVSILSAVYILYIYDQRSAVVEWVPIIGGAYFVLFAIYETFRKA